MERPNVGVLLRRTFRSSFSFDGCAGWVPQAFVQQGVLGRNEGAHAEWRARRDEHRGNRHDGVRRGVPRTHFKTRAHANHIGSKPDTSRYLGVISVGHEFSGGASTRGSPSTNLGAST